MKHFEKKLPITSIDFDRTGDVMVFGSGHNWHKGYGAKPFWTSGIYVHRIDPKNLELPVIDSLNCNQIQKHLFSKQKQIFFIIFLLSNVHP